MRCFLCYSFCDFNPPIYTWIHLNFIGANFRGSAIGYYFVGLLDRKMNEDTIS